MPQLSQKAIEEFQSLWKKHCDEELSLDEAEIKAHDVFAVLRLALEKPEEKQTIQIPDITAIEEELKKMQTIISI